MDNNYSWMLWNEYENRSNGSRCVVVEVDGDIVYFSPTEQLSITKKSPYHNFKRAWANRGYYYPLVGRVYKKKQSAFKYRGHDDLVFVMRIDKSLDFIMYRPLNSNLEVDWSGPKTFHMIYEFFQ